MKQWEMGRSQTPLPPERRAEVPWLFIRQQTGTACWCAAPYRHPAARYPRTTKPRSSRRASGWHDCTRAVTYLPARLGSGPGQIADQSRSAQSPDGYRRRLRGIGCFRCGCAERMSETATLEGIRRRLDGLQNNALSAINVSASIVGSSWWAPTRSCASPPVRKKSIGLPSASTRAWILVLSPPRERPDRLVPGHNQQAHCQRRQGTRVEHGGHSSVSDAIRSGCWMRSLAGPPNCARRKCARAIPRWSSSRRASRPDGLLPRRNTCGHAGSTGWANQAAWSR